MTGRPTWRRASVLVVVSGLLLAAAGRSLAQSASASLVCIILDPSNEALPHATVTLTRVDTAQARQGQSEPNGLAKFLSLAPGRYGLRVSLNGFADFVQTLELTIDDQRTLPVKLEIALRKREDVDVTASDQPLIEPSKTSLGRTITRQETDALPITTGLFVDFPSLAVLTPGIVTDPAGSGLATAGQTGSDNSFYLDSLSIDSAIAGSYTATLPLDAVQEFRVVSNHSSAEFGQASGAIVNIITRSGTNSLAGRASFFLQDSAWNPTSAAARLAGTTDPAYGDKLGGGFLSGPIVRNRAFAFASFEQAVLRTSYVDTSPVLSTFRPMDPVSWPIETHVPKVFARTDVNLGRSNSLAVRTTTQVNHTTDNQREDRSAFERGRSLSNRLWTLGGNDTQIIGSSAVNEIRTQVTQGDFETDVSGFCPDCVALNYRHIKLGKPNNAPQKYLSTRAEAADVLTWLVPTKGARHTLKAGVDVQFVQQSGINPNNTSGTYTFANDTPFDANDKTSYPTRFVANFGDAGFRVHEMIASTFGQDEWHLGGGVSINAGLRWDHVTWPVPSGTRNDVAPRLGMSVDPWKTGITVFRAAFGRYYDESQLAIARDSQTHFLQITVTNPGFSGDPQQPDYLAPSPRGPATVQYSVTGVSVMQTPYTDQFSVGVQRQIGQTVGLSIDFVRALGYHLPVGGDLNYPDAVTGVRPNPAVNQIIVTQTRGQSWYTGLQTGLRLHPPGPFSGSVAYTWSSSENDTDGARAFPENQNDILGDRGPSANDARHRLSASGMVELPFQCRVSALVTATSSLPYNETTGDQLDDNHDGVAGNERPPGVGRNSERGSPFFSLNLRFSKMIAVGKSRLELLFEAFNATNHDNWTGYTFVFNQPGFGRPGNAGPPRQIQIGARISF